MRLARTFNSVRQVLAPQRVLLLSCFVVLIVAFAGSQYLLDQPHYNLKPVSDSGVVTVALAGGERITVRGVLDQYQQLIPVSPEDIRPDPDFLNSFAAIDRYFKAQSLLYQALSGGEIVIVDNTGELYTIHARKPGFDAIPFTFWFLNLSGAVALLTGMAFWAYHRGRVVTRILAAGGVGCYVMQVTMAVYASRELALNGEVFLALLHINHFGGMLFVSSLVMLLWFYPSSLGSNRALWFVYSAALLIWFNEIAEWLTWPLSLFYFPALMLTLFAVMLFHRQWLQCRDDPQKRAMYLWLVNSILAGVGLTFTCYIVPMMIYGEPLVSTWVANTFCLLVFMGFVLGVQFSGLFSVERWWLKACLNVVLAFLIIWLDLIAITLLGIQSALGFSVVAVVCFWLYLQLRNRSWQRLSGKHHRETLVKGMMERIEPGDKQQQTHSFYLPEQELMQSLYRPISTEVAATAFVYPQVLENGLKLGVTIPPKAAGNAITEPVNLVFVGKMGGQELFTREDADFARQFIEHSGETHRLHLAREATLLAERQRIMRDLHDEVAPDLAALARRLEANESAESAESARHCLSSLRDIVYSMDDDKERSLWEAVTRWRRELGMLAQTAGADIRWQDELSEDCILSGVQWLQLSRAIRELVNNALRHARATRIDIGVSLENNVLRIQVANNGRIGTMEQWRSGKGMISIRQRVQQLLGTIDWQTAEHECKATVVVPL